MASSSPMTFYQRPLPRGLVQLSSEEGKKRFQSSLSHGEADIFFSLINSFQTQSHPAFCGLTTLAVVLNALRIDPERVWLHPWRWYSEVSFDCCLSLEHVERVGLTMDQLAAVAGCEGSKTVVLRDLDEKSARDLVRESVRGCPDGNTKIIAVCYDRSALSQTGSGHFSPIAAYDEDTDSVLILDVARFKYAPHWVDFCLLLNATRSLDPVSGRQRGFLSFQKMGLSGSNANKCRPSSCCAKKWDRPLVSLTDDQLGKNCARRIVTTE